MPTPVVFRSHENEARRYLAYAQTGCAKRQKIRRRTFSWAELNSNLACPKLAKVRLLSQTSNLIQFEPRLLVKNRKPKLLVKYVIIIYALGSAHERFGVWIKAVPKAKFPAEPVSTKQSFVLSGKCKICQRDIVMSLWKRRGGKNRIIDPFIISSSALWQRLSYAFIVSLFYLSSLFPMTRQANEGAWGRGRTWVLQSYRTILRAWVKFQMEEGDGKTNAEKDDSYCIKRQTFLFNYD